MVVTDLSVVQLAPDSIREERNVQISNCNSDLLNILLYFTTSEFRKTSLAVCEVLN